MYTNLKNVFFLSEKGLSKILDVAEYLTTLLAQI